MLIVTLAKHSNTQSSHGYGCVPDLHVSNTLIDLPFFSTFDLTLKILCYSGYSETDCYCGADPGMPAYWRANLYQLRVVVQSSLPLFSDFTKESLVFDCWKSRKTSEVFSVFRIIQHDRLNVRGIFIIKMDLYKVLSSSAAPGSCILCHINIMEP